MKKGKGLPICADVSIGPAVVYWKPQQKAGLLCGTPDEEQEKFELACRQAKKQLVSILRQTSIAAGQEEAAILEVQLMMLEDPDFTEEVSKKITLGFSATEAVQATGTQLAQLFLQMDDDYMCARSADILDISSRVADILLGTKKPSFPDKPFMLIAEDLSPSETVQLPQEQLLGFIIRRGSSSSHTAILARMLNIPSLVQADIDLEDAANATVCAIDGISGCWYLDPDETTLRTLNAQKQKVLENQQKLEQYRSRPTITKAGKQVHLFANIASVEDAKSAMEGDAEGIGLLRSEFLYLGRNALPAEEELFAAYQQIALLMQGKPVMIRTLDIGADKQADYLHLPPEENPALGLRGLRFCLSHKDIFRTQLRAIYRASHYGNVHIMFPMVVSLWELQEARQYCEEVRAELAAPRIPIGIMIETPAAAVMAEQLTRHADFISVGTNDLTQYTLAADRQNPHLKRFYDPRHPAVLSLLEHIAKCAGNAGIRAGICGELGADASLTERLIQMGYTTLSLSAGEILATRKRIFESEV